MAESGVTTWVAGYAAVVATLALLWNVYVAWRDRADVRVSFRFGSLSKTPAGLQHARCS
jgi:hypothetical protein